ncbi:MAG: hypothetical protein ABJP41_04655 [Paracoccaceae bacterium]
MRKLVVLHVILSANLKNTATSRDWHFLATHQQAHRKGWWVGVFAKGKQTHT